MGASRLRLSVVRRTGDPHKMMDLQTKQAADIRAILTADQQKVLDKNLLR
jgi:hypothetical protein